MIKAFFVDFYGTVVHEDGEIIKKITEIIYDTGKVENKSEIGAFWWNDFQSMFLNSYGDSFETQRVLEEKSLEHTLAKFCSTANAKELSNYMFEHWIKLCRKIMFIRLAAYVPVFVVLEKLFPVTYYLMM